MKTNSRPFRAAEEVHAREGKGAAANTVATLLICLFAICLQAATNTVNTLDNSGAGSLRQAILDSTTGDVIALGVTGTIALTSGEIAISNSLSITGPGMTNLSISSSGLSRVFNISPNVTVMISGVSLSGGHAADGTNGVIIDWMTITSGGPGESGGAIKNAGDLTLVDCRLSDNSAGKGGNGTTYPSSPGGSAGGPGGAGGAIHNTGTLNLTNCIIEGNSAGNGGTSGAILFGPTSGPGGSGGGIYSQGTLRMHNCLVRANVAGTGGSTPVEAPGATGGNGAGVASSGDCIASGSTFCNNIAGAGGPGGIDTGSAGTGGGGGSGGALFLAARASLTNCTIALNSAGTGGKGGDGSDTGQPGNGGAGGNGGAIQCTGNVTIVNCTICSNAPGSGGVGGYRPPNPYFPFPAFGSPGSAGSCGGVACSDSSAQLLNTISAANQGNTPDASSAIASLGHNLIGATNGSLAFRNTGDLAGSTNAPLDARLGSLTNNGGPTPTIALLPDSPALNAGDGSGAPPTDQRGVPRPRVFPDIGAFEFPCNLPIFNSINCPTPDIIWFELWGLPNQNYLLLGSTNLVEWFDFATGQADTNGVLRHTNSSPHNFQFYRARATSN